MLPARHDDDDDKYLGILEAEVIKQAGIKEKIIHLENKKTTRNQTAEQKSYQTNKIYVPLVRYSAPFLKWAREELQRMD